MLLPAVIASNPQRRWQRSQTVNDFRPAPLALLCVSCLLQATERLYADSGSWRLAPFCLLHASQARVLAEAQDGVLAANAGAVLQGLAYFPGWGEKNFQVPTLNPILTRACRNLPSAGAFCALLCSACTRHHRCMTGQL